MNKSHQFVFFLVLFTIGLDFFLGGFVYNKLYFSEKSKSQDRLIHSAIGTNEDILIFGSSRAYHHYDPEVFEKELNLSCFNVGYGGQNIYFHLALLKSALERKKPQIVILDLMHYDFQLINNKDEDEKLGVLLPFVHESNVIKETVFRRSSFEKIKLLSSIYPLNSKQLYMLRNNLTSSRSDFKGYVGLERVWEKPIETKEVKQIDIDENKMKAIDDFINLCKKNDIKIFICVSPHYLDFKGKTEYDVLAKNLNTKHQLEIINFENNPDFFKNSQYFSDAHHLNKTGSNLYSKEIAKLIKNHH